MELDFSQQIFKKILDNEFYENSSSGNQVVPCGGTDEHDEANNRFSQFCERA